MNSPAPLVEAFAFKSQPCEYKVVALRECPTPQDLALCDTPNKVAAYWQLSDRAERGLLNIRDSNEMLLVSKPVFFKIFLLHFCRRERLADFSHFYCA